MFAVVVRVVIPVLGVLGVNAAIRILKLLLTWLRTSIVSTL